MTDRDDPEIPNLPLPEEGGATAKAMQGVGASSAYLEKLERVQVEKENQLIALRGRAFWLTILFFVILLYLELRMLECIFGENSTNVSDLTIVLAIAPIAAGAAIMVFLLIGVFRGYISWVQEFGQRKATFNGKCRSDRVRCHVTVEFAAPTSELPPKRPIPNQPLTAMSSHSASAPARRRCERG